MEYHNNQVKLMDLIASETVISDEALGKLFIEFIKEFKTTHKSYYTLLHANLAQNIYSLTAQLEDLGQFSQDLFNRTVTAPDTAMEVFETAVRKTFGLASFQLAVNTTATPTKIRELSAQRANRIVKVHGIVVSASGVVTKPKELHLTCRNCLQSRVVRDAIPRACGPQCPIDPYIVVPEKSVVSDVQYAKVQESFEEIPAGETPRHFSLVLEGALVNRISPGTQIRATGIYSIRSTDEKTHSFLRVLGIEAAKSKIRTGFTEEEEAKFKSMAREDNLQHPEENVNSNEPKARTANIKLTGINPLTNTGIYERIAMSIAPGVFGHEDVKKTLACMLFGGTRRTREDGITLRGDINVLLLGDPGIAKSQLLKFMESAAPIGVYTSGKGSSAAGLTASIIRDKGGEFYLEGGALVLADGGICCIDEFDKMNEHDRVAIHEAMEQQTISIAKAGITTVLNSRTAVLAAANPVFGRYDDFKTPTQNIEFGSTILSRFDCIFIIKDRCGPNDKTVAEHVLSLHSGTAKLPEGLLPVETIRAYVQYARTKVFPTLSEAASAKLNRFYVDIRRQVAEYQDKASVPITVRQLEAIIRLSESLARMELSSTVTSKHVDEAIRLFQVSTMNAVAQGHMIEGMTRPEYLSEIEELIDRIEKTIPVGTTVRFKDLLKTLNTNENLARRAVDFMVQQNRLISKDYGRIVIRRP